VGHRVPSISSRPGRPLAGTRRRKSAKNMLRTCTKRSWRAHFGHDGCVSSSVIASLPGDGFCLVEVSRMVGSHTEGRMPCHECRALT